MTTTTVNSELATGKPTNTKAGTSRIITMDYLKGVAAFWFTLAHMAMYFNDKSWMSIMGTAIIVLDWLTVDLFLTITVVGTMVSIKKKVASGKSKGMFATAVQKSVFLLIVGLIMNIVIDARNDQKIGIWLVFGANMISVIAIVQLFTYMLVKMKRWLRLVLLAAIFVIYPVLLNACFVSIGFPGYGVLTATASRLTTPGYIVYYLLFHMDAMAPLFEWLIVAILASLVFEEFARSAAIPSITEQDPQGLGNPVDPNARATKNLAIAGLLCVACSVLFGGFLLTKGIGPSYAEYYYLHEGDQFSYYTPEGLPLFLMRHFPNYMVFNVGVLSIIFAALHHASAFQRKRLFLQDTFVIAGQYSFTIFVYGHASFLLGLSLTVWQYIVICIPIGVTVLAAVRVWARRARGIGSLEWLMVVYMQGLQRLEKRFRQK
jgi:hypothetical protein